MGGTSHRFVRRHGVSYSPIRLVRVVEVEVVEDAVEDGGQDDAHRGEEDHAAEKGVGGGEELRGGILHRVDRAHAGQDHRGVQEGVEPRQCAR